MYLHSNCFLFSSFILTFLAAKAACGTAAISDFSEEILQTEIRKNDFYPEFKIIICEKKFNKKCVFSERLLTDNELIIYGVLIRF